METNKIESKELKERLILAVVNHDDNRESLEGFPYIKRGDFAVLMQLLAGEQNQEGHYTAYLTVTNDMQKKWDIPEHELFEMAKNNSKRLFPVKILNLMEFAEARQDAVCPDGIAAPEGFVLTNEKYFNGAATLFYEPAILDEISKRMGKKDIMVFPAGVNEIYCLPADSPEALTECQELFDNFVKEMERPGYLSKDVLKYDITDRSLKNVSGNEVDLNIGLINEINGIKKNVQRGR